MLLRYRRTGLEAIIGPCHEGQPPAGGAPAGNPAPPATGEPPAPPAGGGTPPATGTGAPPAGDDRSGWIPRDRFDTVNTEYQRLKKAEDDRAAKDAKDRGDFETLHAQEKAKTEAAEEKATLIARRGAFIARASAKVADADAAYKLALADGMLADLAVDDQGDADPKAVDKIVDKVIEKYEFLKVTDKSRSFGDPRGGTPPANGQDLSKMTGSDMLRAGYAQIGEPKRS